MSDLLNCERCGAVHSRFHDHSSETCKRVRDVRLLLDIADDYTKALPHLNTGDRTKIQTRIEQLKSLVSDLGGVTDE